MEKNSEAMRNNILSMKKEIERISSYFENDLINQSMIQYFGGSLLDIFDNLSLDKQIKFYTAFIEFYEKIMKVKTSQTLEN